MKVLVFILFLTLCIVPIIRSAFMQIDRPITNTSRFGPIDIDGMDETIWGTPERHIPLKHNCVSVIGYYFMTLPSI
ncbi:unnamed protein product [Adineta ricciae]|uniref:Uncharacterized protein n=1 Tax=Adineta ricciae TaxID=249248 RepID=A0A814H2E2_ADIRI|nr:unnamed protein product [Adineta ricciae]CAF1609178.1 unnamed protein product [Adineta ricciae]